jgi:hypothetical protein
MAPPCPSRPLQIARQTPPPPADSTARACRPPPHPQVKSLQATIKALKQRADGTAEVDDRGHTRVNELLGDATNTLQGTGPGGDL